MRVFIENEAGSDKKNIFNEKTLEYKKTLVGVSFINFSMELEFERTFLVKEFPKDLKKTPSG